VIKILVDSDGCPVKNEIYRVARRYKLMVFVVTNSKLKIPAENLIKLVIVKDHFDAADDWIVDHVVEGDIVVSADIPLAARCIKKGAGVIDPRGHVFTEDSIGPALANRDLMAYLRDTGEVTRGPAPFEKRDRSSFLQRLDEMIQAAFKAHRSAQ
jgi:hypothetical protein